MNEYLSNKVEKNHNKLSHHRATLRAIKTAYDTCNFMSYIFRFIINYFKQSRQYHTESNKYENQIINIRKRAACYKSKRVLHLTQLHSSSTHSSSLILLYPAPLNHFSPNHSPRRQLNKPSVRVLNREHHVCHSKAWVCQLNDYGLSQSIHPRTPNHLPSACGLVQTMAFPVQHPIFAPSCLSTRQVIDFLSSVTVK